MRAGDLLLAGVIVAWTLCTTVVTFLLLDAVTALRDRHIRRGPKRRKS